MSDLARNDVTSAVVQQAGEFESTLNERLTSFLPEVKNPDGGVDWKKVNALALSRETGSVVLAHALPELMFDYAREIGHLEREGKTDEALSIYELSRDMRVSAQYVLGRVSATIFGDQPNQEGAVLYRRNGEATTKGAVLVSLGETLTMRMQADRITSDKKESFYEELVQPTVELVQAGFEPEAALQAADLARRFDFAADELAIVATQYGIDLADEDARELFSAAVRRVDSLDDLVRYSDGHGGLDADVLEVFTEEDKEADALANIEAKNSDDDEEDEEVSEEAALTEELDMILSELDDQGWEQTDEEREEDENIRAVLKQLEGQNPSERA